MINELSCKNYQLDLNVNVYSLICSIKASQHHRLFMVLIFKINKDLKLQLQSVFALNLFFSQLAKGQASLSSNLPYTSVACLNKKIVRKTQFAQIFYFGGQELLVFFVSFNIT